MASRAAALDLVKDDVIVFLAGLAAFLFAAAAIFLGDKSGVVDEIQRRDSTMKRIFL